MSNVHRIAKFYKVSMDQWEKDNDKWFYGNIQLPKRATAGSAGYDFFAPYGFEVMPHDSILVHTGIRVDISKGWVLQLHVRSSMGIKHGIQLANVTGIVDEDYFYANNEGHIMLKLVNTSDKPWAVEAGDRICQGIFVPFGITVDDDTINKRTGGVGSTGK